MQITLVAGPGLGPIFGFADNGSVLASGQRPRRHQRNAGAPAGHARPHRFGKGIHARIWQWLFQSAGLVNRNVDTLVPFGLWTTSRSLTCWKSSGLTGFMALPSGP